MNVCLSSQMEAKKDTSDIDDGNLLSMFCKLNRTNIVIFKKNQSNYFHKAVLTKLILFLADMGCPVDPINPEMSSSRYVLEDFQWDDDECDGLIYSIQEIKFQSI